MQKYIILTALFYLVTIVCLWVIYPHQLSDSCITSAIKVYVPRPTGVSEDTYRNEQDTYRKFFWEEAVQDIDSLPLRDLGSHVRNEYDYHDIKYPIPFNILFNNITYRYENYGKKNLDLPGFVLTGDLPELNYHYSDVLVMTGASDNHAFGSFNLLYSVLLSDPYSSLLYIDLGLSRQMLQYLKAHFETLKQIQIKLKSNGFLAYRRFNWDSFPAWMNLHKTGNSKRGGYAWKPISIYDAFTQWKGLFSWLDAGNVIVDSFSKEFSFARRYGFYAPPSSGNIQKWTHPDMISFMRENNMIKDPKNDGPNCSSGIVFIDYSFTYTHELIRRWMICAYTSKCIAPKKASHSNHRFDQAVLSLLINHYHIPNSSSYNTNFHPALRNENGDVTKILANLVVSLQYSYHIKLNNTQYDFSGFKYSSTLYKYTIRALDM